MANKDFTDLKSLFNYLEQQLQSTNKQEGTLEVRETMQEHIQTDVYDMYDPVRYERQEYNGGLIADSNIEISVVDNNTISVENIRFDGDREVAAIVESGQGYEYQFPFNGVPRPFTKNTYEELASTDRLRNAFIRGLRKRGIKAEK